jgi:hypothetical protein
MPEEYIKLGHGSLYVFPNSKGIKHANIRRHIQTDYVRYICYRKLQHRSVY